MTTFSKDEMAKATKTIQKSLKQGKGVPSSILMKARETGKQVKVDKKHLAGLFEGRNVFIMKNGRYPNYSTLNSVANNPLVMNYQNNSHNCCPASLNMAIQMLYGWKSEKKCAEVLGTNSSGTAPDQLINNAPKLGYTVKRIGRNYSAVKASLQKGLPVIAHIQTKPASCLGYIGDYGHYILIYGYTSDGYYKIADPTKGLKTCKPSILDRATNGRDIGYYQVKPK